MKTDLLLLVKKGNLYGSYTATKNSGLYNAVRILKHELERNLGLNVEFEVCVDANEIDKYVTRYKPKICLMEAIWVTPTKMREITKLHKKVNFVTRVHSKIPFLSQEGNAMAWIKELSEIKGSYLAFNNFSTHQDFKRLGISNIYLPNVYRTVRVPSFHEIFRDWNDVKHYHGFINIGCFGAIRPLKNQLIQAVAAMSFADKHNLVLFFHINSSRVEQRGESVLKNLRGLFNGTKHKLVEHPWMEPEKFDDLISKMDVSMQVSYTESFNIVTADAVYNEVPVVVSSDISWAHDSCKAYTNSVKDIMEVLEYVSKFSHRVANGNLVALSVYNKKALRQWNKIF